MEDNESDELDAVADLEDEEERGDELGFDPVALVEAALSGRRVGPVDDDESLQSKPRDIPKIDHLPDAIEVNYAGTPIFLGPVGSRVVIERRSGLLHGRPWIDTKVYEVRGIDHDSGLLKLWDLEARHHARDNFKAGVALGSRYKVPPNRGRWDVPPKVARERVVVERVETILPDGTVKRRRGRPPGAKNRAPVGDAASLGGKDG